jgi:tetratricopeptide (TPR) repeat protein
LAPAINLFKSIIPVKVTGLVENDHFFSAIENKVWCLEELGQVIWLHEKDAGQALQYINEAIDLAQAYPWKFYFVVRGELLRNRWDILQASGQGGIAHQEAVEQSQKVFPVRGKSNSVLFHAFSFLSDLAKSANNIQLAILMLRKALRFFPEDHEDIKELNAIWKNRHYQPEDTYQNLTELTQHCDLVWDDAGEDVPASNDQGLYNPRGKFSEGLIRIEKNGKLGFANETEQIHIEPIYDDARNFSEGLACVQLRGKWGYIDASGTVVKDCQLQEAYSFNEGLARAKKNDLWGFIGKNGQWVIPPKYDFCSDFHEGLAEVIRRNRHYFINVTGNITIPFISQYEFIGNFKEGMLVVAAGDKYGFIDRCGRLTIPLSFDNAGDFCEGLARVDVSGKWGYIDKSGKLLISPEYENAQNFSEGMAAVQVAGKWGYINYSGEFVIMPAFDEAAVFRDGQACVGSYNGKFTRPNVSKYSIWMGGVIWVANSGIERLL